MLLDLLDHAIEIGIAGSKAPCEPVATALGNPLAIRDHLELTGLASRSDGCDVQMIFDEGHDTLDLGLVARSGRAANDFNFHPILQSASCNHLGQFVESWDLEGQSRK